ncbi:MAG: ornithine cyclodeaminase [Variovorax sp.]|nr:MAG: ornithine cyclodeaminase [Variovorax sp.]
MTRFVDVPTMSRLIQAIGLPRFIGELADAIQADFLRWDEFDKSARPACHSPLGVIELMPVAGPDTYAFKYVNGHPGNTARGLYTVMAFGVLAEVATGRPVLLSELTLATALRTCATSLVAARALARPASRRMALIGNGAQSEFQALAFHLHLGIDELTLYDVDPRATDRLARHLAPWPDLRLIRCGSIAEAVRGADIVTTLTADKTRATILTPGMIEPGMHVNAVGGDCPGKTELHADVLRGARVVVEYEPQTRVEGDIQQLPADFPVVPLWRVLAGTAAGRQSADQVTVFDSVGFALEDYSTLRYVLAQAQRHGLGVEIDLVPATDDPKDLFRHIRAAPDAALGGGGGAAASAGSADVERGGVLGGVAVVDVGQVHREAGAPALDRAHLEAGVEHL